MGIGIAPRKRRFQQIIMIGYRLSGYVCATFGSFSLTQPDCSYNDDDKRTALQIIILITIAHRLITQQIACIVYTKPPEH